MAINPSLDELKLFFQDTLERSVIEAVYYDVHREGSVAMEILGQLQDAAKSDNNSSTRNSTLQFNADARPFSPSGAQSVMCSSSNGSTSSHNTYHNVVPTSNGTRNKNSVPRKQAGKDQNTSRSKDEIQCRIPGYFEARAMYIMRGLSGSGKSTYANRIIKELGKGEIFSTDDFFYLNEGNEYRFEYQDLERAHAWNRDRVFGALDEGISPVIIDNTNTQFWEMRPYVIEAVENSYKCYFIEPPTKWKFNLNELVKRSTHGVAKATILSALKRYEKNPTVEKVIGNGYVPKASAKNPKSSAKGPIHPPQNSTTENGYVPFSSQNPNASASKGPKHPKNVFLKPRPLTLKSNFPIPNCHDSQTRNDKSNSKITESPKTPCINQFQPLVPYSTDSDEPNSVPSTPKRKQKGKRTASKPQTSDTEEFKNNSSKQALSHHDREHNNNSVCPKVRPRPSSPVVCDGNALWRTSVFSEGNPDNYNDWDTVQGYNWNDNNDSNWNKDLSDSSWNKDLGDKILEKLKNYDNPRATVENDLLEKLENDNGGIVEESLVNLMEHQDVHKTSTIKLTVWHDNDAGDAAVSCSSHKGVTPDYAREHCPGGILPLSTMCFEKLKTVLRLSFYTSPHYLELCKETMGFPNLCASLSLPDPPSAPLEDRGPSRTSMMPSQQSPHSLWREHVSITHEFVDFTADPVSAVKCGKKKDKFPVGGKEEERRGGEEKRVGEEEVKEEETGRDELSGEQVAIIANVKSIMGNTDKLHEVCEECSWDETEILEYLLLKKSMRELEEETLAELSMRDMIEEALSVDVGEETQEAAVPKPKIPPPTLSYRRVLKLSGDDEDEQESNGEQGEEQQEESASDQGSVHKARYDSKDDTEVGSILLDRATVNTLTGLFGNIVGLPDKQAIRIPVNLDLASQLHAALYFAQVEETSKTKGKQKKRVSRKMEVSAHFPPLVVNQGYSPFFNDIVQQQSQMPPKSRQLKQLMEQYPGMDEDFLRSLLDSVGNRVEVAASVLKQENVYIPNQEDKQSTLYSKRAEASPCGTPPPDTTQYLYLATAAPSQYAPKQLNFLQRGSLEEQVSTYEGLAEQSLKQAADAHSRKQGQIASHYAQQATMYKEHAATARRQLFNKSVTNTLQNLKNSSVLDLHGLTLSQSKILVEHALLYITNLVNEGAVYGSLTVITGKGLHSSGGVPVLKNGIRTFLNHRSLSFTELDDGFKVKFR